MSDRIKSMFCLSSASTDHIDSRIEKLESEGVKVSDQHSGDINFNGCAKGYCQAWD